jgi:hypothetical protein
MESVPELTLVPVTTNPSGIPGPHTGMPIRMEPVLSRLASTATSNALGLKEAVNDPVAGATNTAMVPVWAGGVVVA